MPRIRVSRRVVISLWTNKREPIDDQKDVKFRSVLTNKRGNFCGLGKIDIERYKIRIYRKIVDLIAKKVRSY